MAQNFDDLGVRGRVHGEAPTQVRPANERAFLLIPVGYPADDCQVPKKALWRKPIEDVMVVV